MEKTQDIVNNCDSELGSRSEGGFGGGRTLNIYN